MTNDIEIDELLSKFFTGEATPEEAINLESWKAKSFANKSYFDDSAAIFGMPDIINQNDAKIKAWKTIKTDINKYEDLKKFKLLRWRLGVAASVALLVTIALLINHSYNKLSNTIAYNTKTISKKIQLSDASEITIAPNSTLVVDKEFDKTNRRITLTGSASFSIKHDSTKPFIIDMNKLIVKDLGTKFTINTSVNLDTVFISIHEGKVLVYDNLGSSANILANEKARYIKSIKKLETFKNEHVLINTDTPHKKIKPDTRLNVIPDLKKHFQDTVKAVPPKKANENKIKPISANNTQIRPKESVQLNDSLQNIHN